MDDPEHTGTMRVADLASALGNGNLAPVCGLRAAVLADTGSLERANEAERNAMHRCGDCGEPVAWCSVSRQFDCLACRYCALVDEAEGYNATPCTRDLSVWACFVRHNAGLEDLRRYVERARGQTPLTAWTDQARRRELRGGGWYR